MKHAIGSRVSFSWVGQQHLKQEGTGEVLTDEDSKGRVQVALDPVPPEARHFIILCTSTWLTPVTS